MMSLFTLWFCDMHAKIIPSVSSLWHFTHEPIKLAACYHAEGQHHWNSWVTALLVRMGCCLRHTLRHPIPPGTFCIPGPAGRYNVTMGLLSDRCRILRSYCTQRSKMRKTRDTCRFSTLLCIHVDLTFGDHWNNDLWLIDLPSGLLSRVIIDLIERIICKLENQWIFLIVMVLSDGFFKSGKENLVFPR